MIPSPSELFSMLRHRPHALKALGVDWTTRGDAKHFFHVSRGIYFAFPDADSPTRDFTLWLIGAATIYAREHGIYAETHTLPCADLRCSPSTVWRTDSMNLAVRRDDLAGLITAINEHAKAMACPEPIP